MKAEIEGYNPDHMMIRVTDDEGLFKGLYVTDDELEAIHAALTEWKAKREEKPKLRPFKDAAEVPMNAIAIRWTDQHAGLRHSFSVTGNSIHAAYLCGEHAVTYRDIRFKEALTLCELILADGSIVPCGVYE